MTIKQITIPELAEGERYLCGVIAENGTITHTILLPGDNEGANWKSQMDWAKSIGGDLLSRPEQAIGYARMPEEFKKDAYWSNQQHDTESGWAWYQHFDYGTQRNTHKDYELRARAVRRLVIE